MFDKKLHLASTLDSTYLIQRLEKPWKKKDGTTVINPFSFGGGLVNGGLSKEALGAIKEIMAFDYMGASEFEWGAVPNALIFLAEQAQNKNIVSGEMSLEGNTIYYVCPKSLEKEIVGRIKSIYADEQGLRLKEYCGLQNAFDKNPRYQSRICGWLELDNGFMFFKDREMYDGVCGLFVDNSAEAQ